MTTTTESEYMTFERHDMPDRKTPVMVVRNKRSGDKLGEVHWYGAWRQFVFEPLGGTILNSGCMTDIQAVIAQLMEEWRKKVKR